MYKAVLLFKRSLNLDQLLPIDSNKKKLRNFGDMGSLNAYVQYRPVCKN